MTTYEQQAKDFLSANSIGLRATFHDNQTCPPWDDSRHIHGDRYRITIWRKKERSATVYTYPGVSMGQPGTFCGHTDYIQRFSFDFWNSANDSQNGKEPTAYDVLACISSDAYTPETFSDFCSGFGYEEDSRKALQTFKAADKLARRIRAYLH